MAKGKKSSTSAKNYYSRYKTEGLHEKHKIAKIERHINNHPGDDNAKIALKRIKDTGAKYTRNNNGVSGIKNSASYMYKETKGGGTKAILRTPSKYMRSLNGKFRAAKNESAFERKQKREPKFTCLGDALRHVKVNLR
jgi:hypothetical protein